MFLPVLFFLAAVCSAQDLNSAARELARKIGRQDIASVTVRNLSSLRETAAAEVKRAIESELRVRPGGAGVTVTLSENVQGYLWVAEIQRGAERDVVMLSVSRPTAPAPSAAVTIEKRQLWEQEKPILDVARAGSWLIVLDPASVSLYRDRLLLSSLSVSIAGPMSRDPRGWLSVEGDTFQAFLPGLVCSGRLAQDPVMSCAESNTSGIAPGRNVFSEPPLPTYFSKAALPGMKVVAGADGRARFYDNGLREIGSITGWGSDIAGAESECGPKLLASKATEPGEPDSIQAYEWNGAKFIMAGDPVLFPGPVTALWRERAVARDSQTGRYAAYSLAITCGR